MPSILITGANRGIGLGFAQHYLAQNWQVFASSRKLDALNNLKESYPQQLQLIELELSSITSIQQAYEAVASQVKHLDILINNAGIFQKSDNLNELSADALRASFEVNTIAPIMMAKTFIPLLKTGSKLINITMPSRPVSQLSRKDNHAYIASRYALNALTKMLAIELGESGLITVALYPGYLQTDMNQYAAEAKPVDEGIPLAARVIDGLSMDDNGKCFMPDGKVYEW